MPYTEAGDGSHSAFKLFLGKNSAVGKNSGLELGIISITSVVVELQNIFLQQSCEVCRSSLISEESSYRKIIINPWLKTNTWKPNSQLHLYSFSRAWLETSWSEMMEEIDYTFFFLAIPFLRLTLGLIKKFTFSRLKVA